MNTDGASASHGQIPTVGEHDIYPESHFDLETQRDSDETIQRAISITQTWNKEHTLKKKSFCDNFMRFVEQVSKGVCLSCK